MTTPDRHQAESGFIGQPLHANDPRQTEHFELLRPLFYRAPRNSSTFRVAALNRLPTTERLMQLALGTTRGRMASYLPTHAIPIARYWLAADKLTVTLAMKGAACL